MAARVHGQDSKNHIVNSIKKNLATFDVSNKIFCKQQVAFFERIMWFSISCYDEAIEDTFCLFPYALEPSFVPDLNFQNIQDIS